MLVVYPAVRTAHSLLAIAGEFTKRAVRILRAWEWGSVGLLEREGNVFFCVGSRGREEPVFACARADAVGGGGGCGEVPALGVLQYEEGKVMAVTLTSLSGWLSGQGRSRELSRSSCRARLCVALCGTTSLPSFLPAVRRWPAVNEACAIWASFAAPLPWVFAPAASRDPAGFLRRLTQLIHVRPSEERDNSWASGVSASPFCEMAYLY